MGSDRIEATSNGCPDGKNSVATTYVVPQEIGASAVSNMFDKRGDIKFILF